MARAATTRRWILRPVLAAAWLLYAAAMIWYPIHVSVVAREHVAAGQFAKCRQHAASVEAIKFCDGDYIRDLDEARQVRWEQHPLWHPLWLGLLVLLLPPLAIFGTAWIMTRGSFSSAGTPAKQAVPSR